jgi:hypothetical protein
MATDLMDYLADQSIESFSPIPLYSREGDFLTYFFNNDDAYAHRVDELLTVYLSDETDDLVGCKIKGVQQILDTLGSFSVVIEDSKISLGLLFLAGMAVSKSSEKSQYEEIGRRTKNILVDRQELQSA